MLQFSELAIALVFLVVLIALPVALLVALALVRRFRIRVRDSMRSTAGGSVDRNEHQLAPHDPHGRLEIEVVTVTEQRRRAARRQSRLVQMRRRARAVALTYAGAASILPLFLATQRWFTVPFSAASYVGSALWIITLFLVHATPV